MFFLCVIFGTVAGGMLLEIPGAVIGFFIGLLFYAVLLQKQKISGLEDKLSELRNKVIPEHKLEEEAEEALKPETGLEKTPETVAPALHQLRAAPKREGKEKEPVHPEAKVQPHDHPKESKLLKAPALNQKIQEKPKAIDKLTKQLLENWTGILGTIVLVTGIGFLGTYAALRLPAFGRFVLVVAASVALFIGYLVLRKKERWQDMALWLRSSAAAVFLFACAAAGGLPNVGIMWIENANAALLLLLFGISINLSLSWFVCRQGFASLHVVLSLIPMAILPQVLMTLGIATIVSAFGVILAYRNRWQLHLLITVLVYSAYHIYWVTKQATTLPLPGIMAAFAVSSAAVVFLGGVLVAYHRKSANEPLTLESGGTHLLCWGFLATAFFMHLRDISDFPGMILDTTLLATALIAWGLSIYARKLKVEWLCTVDVLTAQAFALVGLACWYWQLGSQVMFLVIIYLETLLFLRFVIKDFGILAARIAGVIVLAAAIMLLIETFRVQQVSMTSTQMWQLSGVLFAGAFITMLAGANFMRKFGPRFKELAEWQPLLITGPLTGVMIIFSLFMLQSQMLSGTIAMLSGLVLLYASHRLSGLGMAWGTWMVLVASNLFVWGLSYFRYAGSMMQQLAQLAPVTVLTMLAIWRTPSDQWQKNLRNIAVYLMGIHFGLSVYLLLNPVSALLPTVVWFMLSIIALEIARRSTHAPTLLPVLLIGYAYIVAAGFGYVLVVMPTNIYIGSIRLRLAIEVYGVSCLFYWWLTRPSEQLAKIKYWQRIQPYSLELALLLIVATVLLEVPLILRPVAWMVFAFLFLIPSINRFCPRIAFYSLASFITSVLALTANVSIVAVPSPYWYHQPWPIGLVAVAIQLSYLFVAYHRLKLEQVRFQPELNRLDHLSQYLGKNLAATICYPFFAGLALFLAWRFEQAILTFLWASETFAIFVLSIVLRQNHFRLVALAGLAACLFRLLVYDMHETELFIRGVVFIGVGLLMLAMNAVYNKYSNRMEET